MAPRPKRRLGGPRVPLAGEPLGGQSATQFVGNYTVNQEILGWLTVSGTSLRFYKQLPIRKKLYDSVDASGPPSDETVDTSGRRY
jgi:hypothetical protein